MSLACQKLFLLVLVLIYIVMPLVSSQECERSEFSKQYDVSCGSVRYRRDYCTPGQMVNDPCSDDSVCEYCPAGQYQDMYTNCRTCLPCTREVDCCNDQVLVKQCLSDKNSVCGCPPCPVVTCPTLPAVTCPPVPNVTCPPVTPCPPCPTEPDITTTPENTCPPCPTAEENNPTSPSDGKSNTCPPVEPSLSPGTGSFVFNSGCVHILWKIWGITAFILVPVLLLACIVLCFRGANVLQRPRCPPHEKLDDQKPNDRNGDPEAGNHRREQNQDNRPNLKHKNGDKEEEVGDNEKRVALPPDADCKKGEDAPDNEQSPQGKGNVYTSEDDDNTPLMSGETYSSGTEGGIPKYVNTPLRSMPGNSQHGDMPLQDMYVNSQNGPVLGFARPELGEERMQDLELDAIADHFYDNYWGQTMTSVESFFTKLGMQQKDYGKHLMDKKGESVNTQVFYVLRKWQEECSCTRNYYQKHLRNVDNNFSNWFVRKINKQCAPEDSV